MNMNGAITSFLPGKGYGFIHGDDGQDYFFHVRDLVGGSAAASLHDGMRLRFDPIPTAKGYRAKSVRALEYADGQENAAQQMLERSDWLVQGSSRLSPQAAWQDALEHAKQLGADDLVEQEYFKTTGSEPGTGQGVHHFTVHHWRGRATRRLAAEPSFNALAECYEERLRGAAQAKKQRRLWWYAVIGGSFLLLLAIDKSGTMSSLAPLAMLAAAAAVFIAWLNKRNGRYNDGVLHPLFYSPAAKVGVRSPLERRDQRAQSGRSNGPIRSFVVDEGKLSVATMHEGTAQGEGHTPYAFRGDRWDEGHSLVGSVGLDYVGRPCKMFDD